MTSLKDMIDRAIANALKDAERLDVPVPSDFDEDAYLAEHPDVAGAVATGGFRSGYMHYVLCGRNEGRARPTRLPET